jgi:hypothetical protein
MRRIIIYTAFFLFACTEASETLRKGAVVPELSEQQKRKYFVDNDLGDYENEKSFLKFFDDYYPGIKAINKNNPYPYAFEEEYIDTTKIDSSRIWFRVIVEPCFRLPYALIVNRNEGHYNFTVKLTSGNCNYTGSLFLTMKPFLFDSIGNFLFQKLDSLNYWTVLPEKNDSWTDGETWTYEAIQNGKYNLVRQRLPQYCKNKNALDLYRTVLYIIKFAKLDAVLAALGKPKTGG